MAVFAARWLAGGAAAFVVAGTFTASLTADRGESCEARLRAFVDAAARETASAPKAIAHEPLLDPAHDGDAMPFYRFAAVRLGLPLRGGDPWANDGFANAGEGDWSALEPIVAALRMGALARTCEGEWSDFWAPRRLRTVLSFAWKRAVARGEWRVVVDSWLTEQALQLDTSDPFHVHTAFLDDWTKARFAALDVSSARVLAAGLARLDARWPRALPTRRYLAQIASGALHAEGNPTLRGRLAAWGSGFDPQRWKFDVLCQLHDNLPALANVGVAWPARAEQWDVFLAPLLAGPAAFSGFACWRDGEQRLRRDLASLRLVRLALAFRFGEALPVLADPFADAPLHVHVDGDVATFRSAAGPEVLELRAQRR